MGSVSTKQFVHVTVVLAVLCLGLIVTSGRDAFSKGLGIGGLYGRVCSSADKDWWDCPQLLPDKRRTFNKSVLYLKPHKTGSETFKQVLWRVSDYYGLVAEKTFPKGLSKKERRERIVKCRYDVVTSHAHYREGASERRLRGWDEGEFSVGANGEPAKRTLIRIVTIRNPLDRLFSHYFSQRRFMHFTPSRGFLRPGRLSEEEELEDFLEWLERYPSNQQVRYLMDSPAESSDVKANAVMLQRVKNIVDYYDYVIVADQWKQSICLFGFLERIQPELLQLKKRNSNKVKAIRFDVNAALSNSTIYEKVLSKVSLDFVLYKSLFQKYTQRLDEETCPGLQRYCARVELEQQYNRNKHGQKGRLLSTCR